MYFVLVDRFANGSQRNDKQTDPKDIQAFHGGDLQGVTQKLDYLQQLGADVIWLSPIFHMRTEKFEGHGAFHAAGACAVHADDAWVLRGNVLTALARVCDLATCRSTS